MDSISILRNANQQLDLFKQEVVNQQNITQLTKQRVQYHVSSQLDLLDSERTTLLAHDQEVVAHGRTIQAILLLVKALGGGYDACYLMRNHD
jgi:outer membrane protein TolC